MDASSAHVELQTTCAALGYLERDVYYKEVDCLGKFTFILYFFPVWCFKNQINVYTNIYVVTIYGM